MTDHPARELPFALSLLWLLFKAAAYALLSMAAIDLVVVAYQVF